MNTNKGERNIYQLAFDSVTDLGIVLLDKDGRVILYNEASARNDGIDAQQLLGNIVWDYFQHPGGNSTWREVLETGKPVIDQEIRYKAGDGENYCFGSAYPVIQDGEMLGVISVMRFEPSVRSIMVKMIDMQHELQKLSPKEVNGTHYKLEDILATSEAMVNAVSMARRSAMVSSPVMIYGETGTGKEMFAQGIHNASANANEPFLAVNCAAIPETLMESMLFGTTKGAFTGAQNTAGLFEQAGKGTLFLDEVNSMPLSLQAKILRVLQEKAVRRLGDSRSREVNCRIISSSNKPLLDCVKAGTLRDDLYYRLSVVNLEIPPLRMRKDDITPLTNWFIDYYKRVFGINKITVTDGYRRALKAYTWPGNVRELEHAVESSLVLMDLGGELNERCLPQYIREELHIGEIESKSIMPQNPSSGNIDLHEQLDSIERGAILNALNENNWNISATAKSIGYSRSNLQYRMKKLGISEK